MLKPALGWFGAGFSLPRWLLAAAAAAFSATVSLFRYVDSAWLLDVHLSAEEVCILVLRSPVNAAFIYLPLYLFLACGIAGDLGSSPQALLLCGSRRRYLALLVTRLALVTAAFLALVTAITGAIALQIFPHSSLWSRDFLAWQALEGQSPLAFTLGPLPALGLQLLCRGAAYWLAGCLCLLCGVLWKSELLSLALGLLCGLPAALLEPGLFGACYLAGGMGIALCLTALSALPLWGLGRYLDRADLGEAPV